MTAGSSRPTLVNVVHSLDPGGAERLVVDMSQHFSTDYRVIVVCLDRAGEWADSLRQEGIPVHVLRRQPGLDLLLAWRLGKLLKTVSADIVHAHQTGPWFYSALARLKHRAPRLLFQEHGRLFPEPDSRLRRLVNRALIARLTHRFVAVSRDTRDRLVRYEGIRPDRIEVIYNGGRAVAPPDGAALDRVRKDLGIPANSNVVGFIGRLDPVKNVEMLIKSFASLEARHPGLVCLIVGDGDERERLESLAEPQISRNRVIFTGFRTDADRILHCMDVFVLPSFSEGTSMALLEAMYAGVVPVVTAVGGNIELVEDGVNGRVIAPGSEEELATAIEDIFKNPEGKAQMVAAGKDRFRDNFEFSHMLQSYRNVYSELLQKNSR